MGIATSLRRWLTSQDKALRHGARTGNAREVEILLRRGANGNARDRDGYTALHHAAFAGHANVVKLLLSRGADPNVKTNHGQTPLHVAKESGVAESLLSGGADVNAQDSVLGFTPLHSAVVSRNLHIVDLLLQKAANVDARDNDGMTPLHRTVVNLVGPFSPRTPGSDETDRFLIRTLLWAGANAFARDARGVSAEDLLRSTSPVPLDVLDMLRVRPRPQAGAEAHEAKQDASALDEAVQALSDQEWAVRVKAAGTLGTIGTSRAAEVLVAALKDDVLPVYSAVTDALTRIGPAAVESLLPALKDSDSGVRRAAAKALGDIGDARAVQPLREAANDEEQSVRKAAAKALAQIGQPTEEAKMVLGRFIDNGDETVTDTATGLMWQKEDDGQVRTLSDSEQYCRELRLGRYADWRLPAIEELRSVSRDWKAIFQNPKQDEPYWSFGTENQFFVHYEYYTRAVRSARS
jgi:hypothetical protein